MNWRETTKLGKVEVIKRLKEKGIEFETHTDYFKLCSLLYKNEKPSPPPYRNEKPSPIYYRNEKPVATNNIVLFNGVISKILMVVGFSALVLQTLSATKTCQSNIPNVAGATAHGLVVEVNVDRGFVRLSATCR